MRLEEVLGVGPNLAKLARRVGIPLQALQDALDRPFPLDELMSEAEFKGSIGFRHSILNLAVKERLTVRELSLRYGGGHQEVVGTPEQIARHQAGTVPCGRRRRLHADGRHASIRTAGICSLSFSAAACSMATMNTIRRGHRLVWPKQKPRTRSGLRRHNRHALPLRSDVSSSR
jgi:hypothetical protein